MAVRELVSGAVGPACLCLVLAGCARSPAAAGPRAETPARGIPIAVSSTACGGRWEPRAAGLLTFQIHDLSPNPVEVSLTNAQTGAVYTDVEGIGPGTTRPMQADVGSGTYALVCDASGGARVTGPTTTILGDIPDGAAMAPAAIPDTLAALTSERGYVTGGLATAAQQASLLEADIAAGDLTAARSRWLTAHLAYERLGSAYGMFGGYDDAIDGSPDGLPGGVNDPSFTGFYRMEYGLWHGQSAARLIGPARLLDRDIQALQTAYPGMILYPQAALSDLALRTHEILEHAVRFQLSGADDFGSGTTLATAEANIDATRAQLGMLRPMLASWRPELAAVSSWLDRLQQLISAEQAGGRWTPVSRLSTSRRERIDAAAAETVQLLAPIAAMFESSPLP
jgi:iron uptake system EfeUOB component EfeO/EfeM